jgi:hypothetical protein
MNSHRSCVAASGDALWLRRRGGWRLFERGVIYDLLEVRISHAGDPAREPDILVSIYAHTEQNMGFGRKTSGLAAT